MKARHWIASALALAGATFGSCGRGPPRKPRGHLLDLPPGDETPDSQLGSVQFIGTATVIIRYQGMTILTDPNFLHRGDHVHLGYGMHSQRLTDPAMSFEDLPPVDLVLLSHLHEDHFDKLVEARLARNTPILTTCIRRADTAPQGVHEYLSAAGLGLRQRAEGARVAACDVHAGHARSGVSIGAAPGRDG